MHNPDCWDTCPAPAGSPWGAGTQGFANCQKCISGPPVCKYQKPDPFTVAVQCSMAQLTLCFLPQPLPSSQLAASPEHQHLCPSFCPGVLAWGTSVQPSTHGTGILTKLPATILMPKGMRSLPSISHRFCSS